MENTLKEIPDYPDYFAETSGSVWSVKRGKLKKLKPQISLVKGKPTYHLVGLFKNGRYHQVRVSTIILTTFVSSRPHGMFACHGVKGSLVNSLDNLSWGTPKQNVADMLRDGTLTCGEKHPHHKLNGLQVRIIRRAYSPRGRAGVSARKLATVFSVNLSTVLNIIHGNRWKHLLSI